MPKRVCHCQCTDHSIIRKSPFVSITIHIPGHVRSVISISCCNPSAIRLRNHPMQRIIGMNKFCPVRLCRNSHISGSIIRISNRFAIVSDNRNEFILLIISIKCTLAIFPCFCRNITKSIISIRFRSCCRYFFFQLVLCIITLFTGCTIWISNRNSTILFIILINGFISFIVNCCSCEFAVFKSCFAFIGIDLFCHTTFFIISVLYNRITILIFPACHTAVSIILVFSRISIWIFC